jgi:hypothetical protein
MQDELVRTLQGLRSDPSLVVSLYEQLAKATLLTLVRSGTDHNVAAMEFLTYPSSGMRELPLFTQHNFVLTLDAPGAVLIEVQGQLLWPRLLDVVKTSECEAAVDPGQTHGVRLNREMILGVVAAQCAA